MPFPTRKKPIARDYSKKNLIDTTEDKFAEKDAVALTRKLDNLNQYLDRVLNNPQKF